MGRKGWWGLEHWQRMIRRRRQDWDPESAIWLSKTRDRHLRSRNSRGDLKRKRKEKKENHDRTLISAISVENAWRMLQSWCTSLRGSYNFTQKSTNSRNSNEINRKYANTADALSVERAAVNKIASAPGRGTFWADVGLRINCVTLLCIYLWDAWRLPKRLKYRRALALCNLRWNIHEPPATCRAGMSVPSSGKYILLLFARYAQANDRVIRPVSVNKILRGDIDRNWQVRSAPRHDRKTRYQSKSVRPRRDLNSCRDDKSGGSAGRFHQRRSASIVNFDHAPGSRRQRVAGISSRTVQFIRDL